MKKTIMMMALAFFCLSSISAQDVFKEVSKLKDYNEAEKVINANLGSMSAEEKAKCYNALVDMCYNKIKKDEEILTANQLAEQMKNGKTQEYDTVGLYDAALKAIEFGILCNEADNQPNDKGKVKPVFKKKNAERLYNIRYHLINGGVYYQGKDDKLSNKFLAAYVDSSESPLFDEIDKSQDGNLGQIAYFAAVGAFQAQDYANAQKYADIAIKDPEWAAQAAQINLAIMQSQLKTRADSLSYAERLKQIYAEDESNEVIFSTLTSILASLEETEEFNKYIDAKLAQDPTNFVALVSKGQAAYDAHNWDEAIDYFNKTAEVQPENIPVIGLIGNSYMYKAKDMAESINSGRISPDQEKEILSIYGDAIKYLEQARELDLMKEYKPYWAYPLYNCYYVVYGEDDPRTQDAENATK